MHPFHDTSKIWIDLKKSRTKNLKVQNSEVEALEVGDVEIGRWSTFLSDHLFTGSLGIPFVFLEHKLSVVSQSGCHQDKQFFAKEILRSPYEGRHAQEPP